MTQWLLSIVGVVIISYLIKLLLPENSTKNLIAFILSAVCVLVIINPLNSIFNSQQSVDFDFVSFELDNDYLQFAMQCKKDYYLGEYEIPKFRGYRFHIPVEKYDLNNNFLKKYNSILEAVEDCGGSKQGYTAYKIYRAIKERKGIFKEYIWKEIKK